MTELDSYNQHAQVWGWFSGDRTEEADFWERLAHTYGKRVLALMAAAGDMAAELARRGLQVTAVDFLPAMIAEGQLRYRDVPSLTWFEGDMRSLQLPEQPYDFAFTSDLNHLMTAEDVGDALRQTGQHLRPGGGLALELWYPGETSWASPRRRFDPFPEAVQAFAGFHPEIEAVWKEGQTAYDSSTRRVTIDQQVFVQRNQAVERFSHAFPLQLWSRDEIAELLRAQGYRLVREYGSFAFDPWLRESPKWIVEAVKEFSSNQSR